MDKVLRLFDLEVTHACSLPAHYYFKYIEDRWYLTHMETTEWNEVSTEDVKLFMESDHTMVVPFIIGRRTKVVRKFRLKDLL